MKRNAPAIVFAILVAANLIGTAFDIRNLQLVSKPLLMPALIFWLYRGHAPMGTHLWMLFGLLFAIPADTFLLFEGRTVFLFGMFFFALMQLCFIGAYFSATKVFARWRALPWPPLAYLAFWLGFNALMWTSFGGLAAPIAVYSLLLAIMAAAASTVSTMVGIGGLLFMVSDLMIGLGVVNIDFTGREVAIMATYTLAQFLIVTGISHRTIPRPRNPAAKPATVRA
ncbi:lysoplasmalogenase [Stackebrandtia nassauensis]|uniref:YhhN family protein n=1 Tax=Stackebrandtia nassauensis (strain DSM 44728 / CIP 108903 / NRRL B-16338 / NBRC 102104 / LLR-40K-21) TaxID=446470 RepID=D3QBS1_STANL|nr:lysoplasmalogenase [Stackebrandtia nassauensis]ADD44810.1 YhhN family protein [Stackebrandtia nassauensis DSM 44728]